MRGSSCSIELRPSGASEPDGGRAAVLAAYFKAEDARAWRQATWRWLPPVVLTGWALQSTEAVLSRGEVAAALVACVAIVLAAAILEWRAEQALKDAVAGCPGASVRGASGPRHGQEPARTR